MIDVYSGKVELGQGIRTALTLIAAEELDVDPSRIRLHTAATGLSPDEGVTAGSMSVEHSGAAIRQACAQARRLMLERAARQFGVASTGLRVDDGVVRAPGANAPLTWWDIQLGQRFEFAIEHPVAEKPALDCRWVGKGMRRIDLEDKITGAPSFLHDLDGDDLWHARVIRPNDVRSRLLELDRRALAGAPQHRLVVDGSFVAVAAPDELAVERLAERLDRAARWQAPPPLELDGSDVFEHLVGNVAGSYPLVDGVPREASTPDLPWPVGARRASASYRRPYLMHGSIAPSAAAARFADGRLTLWSHSQSVELLRLTVAEVLDLDPAQVRAVHLEGAGAYGHNGADDVALDAALCARAMAGCKVLMKWNRRQEHAFEPYGPAMQVDMAAALDEGGRIVAWRHDVFSFTHAGRPQPEAGVSGLLAAGQLATPWPRPAPRARLAAEVGMHRNALPIYAVGRQRVIKHFVAKSPLRTSSLRSLGAHANVFAIESFMDELARLAGADVYQFRLRHLDDDRAREVLLRVRAMQASTPRAVRANAGVGRGLGMARYKNRQAWVATVAELAVDDGGHIELLHLWIAADAGRVIDPDGLVNQLEGGAVQSASWALKEALRFDAAGVSSLDWQDYPILRFDEVPEITTALIDRPEQPALGAGEASIGPATAAIANAVFDAVGIRARTLPLTPEALRAAASG